MRDEEFISEVGARAGLEVRDDLVRTVRATLAVLGEQLPDGIAGAVAAALPEQLGAQLWDQGGDRGGDRRGDRKERQPRSRATAAQAGRLSRGVARGEGSWPGDITLADADAENQAVTGERSELPE